MDTDWLLTAMARRCFLHGRSNDLYGSVRIYEKEVRR